MSFNPPRYDGTGRPALPASSKIQKSEVVVELSHTQPPPLFPIELQNYVSPDKWETRVRAITRIASQYSKPTLERCWMLLSLILTFVAPLVAYYVALHHFNRQEVGQREDQSDQFIWESRLIAFGVMVGLWFVMFLPIAVWKYMGRARMNKMVDGWAKDDIRTASSYVAISTWKVAMPGVFRDGIVLVITCPGPPSTFGHESYLPPYIATPSEAAPSYEVTKRFSSLQGEGKFGEIPLYNDSKDIAV